MLIAFGGLPAVGESTLAISLARRIGAVYLRIDTIEQAMRNAGFNVSGPEGYLAARDLAEDNLRIGHTVIVDSVNPRAITRDYWRETAARMTVELVEIEVNCSDQRQHRERVESRLTDILYLVLPTWKQVLDRHYEPCKSAQIIDTAGRSLEDTLSRPRPDPVHFRGRTPGRGSRWSIRIPSLGNRMVCCASCSSGHR